MPLTTIDPVPALVVIDLQNGILAAPTAHPSAGVVENSAALARAFRERGYPVVLVNVTGGAPGRTDASRGTTPAVRPEGWADLVEGLGAQPGDHRVTKQTWGAFHRTGLDEHLRSLDVTQVLVTGISTSAGVESTARSAHENGYHVVLVTDAMTDRDGAAHHHAVTHVFPRLGETTTTAEVLAALAADRPR